MMKRYLFLCFMTWLVVSCAGPQEQASAPLPSTPTSAIPVPTIVPLTSTPAKAFVPKQNDLILIEFFAVT